MDITNSKPEDEGEIQEISAATDEMEEPDLNDRVEAHPIAKSVDKLLHRLHDVRWSARSLIPLAGQILKKNFESSREKMETCRKLLEDDDPSQEALVIKNYLRAIDSIKKIDSSDLIRILETGLFMAAFSSFDAFTGDILSSIYQLKPELYGNINRSISVHELLNYENLSDVKLIVLASEIDSFRRESYVDQFKSLEKRFGIHLRKFDEWPYFVEASQRRNLLTHCDGMVTKQYISICEEEGFVFKGLPSVGDVLGVGADYFFESTGLIMGTGLMLGQSLWRKLIPSELEKADLHLNDTLFRLLEREEWELAAVFAKYAVELKHRSTPVYKRLAIVNYCIALKNMGKNEPMKSLLDSMDWSDTALDFDLARLVLIDDYDGAAQTMEKIGIKGRFVYEGAYHTWPLFRSFVDNDQFKIAYEKIYGHPFITELRKVATDAESKTEGVIKEEIEQLEEGLGGMKNGDDSDRAA
ncbi:MAG: hypothetical protein LCH53_05855 [Bacteroidetes bacterium]|nr:hypothetical protein [Bacteroidota bacterium]